MARLANIMWRGCEWIWDMAMAVCVHPVVYGDSAQYRCGHAYFPVLCAVSYLFPPSPSLQPPIHPVHVPNANITHKTRLNEHFVLLQHLLM